VDNEKMSKSLGNFFTIREVLAKYDPETVRFFIVRVHYRTGLNYSDVHLDDARASLKRLYTALDSVKPAEISIDWSDSYAARFKAAMDEDFGTPEAVAVLFDLATQVNSTKSAQLAGLLKALGGILGLLQNEPTKFLQSGVVQTLDTAQIALRITDRNDAKKAKNFALADAIRNDLLVQGIVLKDSPTGTTWEAA
jgi:cysteinyl-tRNA synthetase